MKENEVKLESINKSQNNNRFISFKLLFTVEFYYSPITLDGSKLEKKCIRINEKMKYKCECLKCPICKYNVCNTEGLYYHNISTHPNYIMRCLYRNNKIIVYIY